MFSYNSSQHLSGGKKGHYRNVTVWGGGREFEGLSKEKRSKVF